MAVDAVVMGLGRFGGGLSAAESLLAEGRQVLVTDLAETFRKVEKENGVPAGDFPDLARMQKQLAEADFSSFPKLNGSMMRSVDDMMRTDITNLMRKIPEEEIQRFSSTHLITIIMFMLIAITYCLIHLRLICRDRCISSYQKVGRFLT